MKLFFAAILTVCVVCASTKTGLAQSGSNPLQALTSISLLQDGSASLPDEYVAATSGGSLALRLTNPVVAKLTGQEIVSLVGSDGTKFESRVSPDGLVHFHGVSDGLHAVTVTSPSTYTAMAIYTQSQPTASAFNIPLANGDLSQIRPKVEGAGRAPVGPSVKKYQDYTSSGRHDFRAYVQADGVVNGQLIVPEGGFETTPGISEIAIYRDSTLVTRTVSTADGKFFVSGLTPGYYTVFVTGPGGHAAFGVEVVAKPAPVTTKVESKNRVIPVATGLLQPTGGPANNLVIVLIPPRLMPTIRQIVQQQYQNSPTAPPPADLGTLPPGGFGGGFPGGATGGGFGGAAGGGGGAAGGIGGLGGLLGIGGLAAGIAAAASNNDSFTVATRVVP